MYQFTAIIPLCSPVSGTGPLSLVAAMFLTPGSGQAWCLVPGLCSLSGCWMNVSSPLELGRGLHLLDWASIFGWRCWKPEGLRLLLVLEVPSGLGRGPPPTPPFASFFFSADNTEIESASLPMQWYNRALRHDKASFMGHYYLPSEWQSLWPLKAYINSPVKYILDCWCYNHLAIKSSKWLYKYHFKQFSLFIFS